MCVEMCVESAFWQIRDTTKMSGEFNWNTVAIKCLECVSFHCDVPDTSECTSCIILSPTAGKIGRGRTTFSSSCLFEGKRGKSKKREICFPVKFSRRADDKAREHRAISSHKRLSMSAHVQLARVELVRASAFIQTFSPATAKRRQMSLGERAFYRECQFTICLNSTDE